MTARSPFASLCSVSFLARFSYALARNPVLPLFALALGAGPEAVGLAVGVSTVTGILFKMPAGALSDVLGRRRVLLTGLCVFAFAPFLYLAVDSYQGLVLVRFIHGFATAVYGPVIMAVVAQSAGGRKGEMLSWFSSVGIVGGLLGAPVGGLLLSLASGPEGYAGWAFPAVYLLCGVSGLGALVLGWRVLPDAPSGHAGTGLGARLTAFVSGIKEVSADRRVLAASTAEGVQNMGLGALEAFLPVYAVTVAGLPEYQAGLLWAAQIVVTLLSKPLLGRFSDQRGRAPLILCGMACCAAPLALIPHLAGFWSLLAACLVFGLGEALVTSSSAALVADVCKERHFGTAMGVFGTLFDVGHASGPILGGILVGLLGLGPAFAVLALILGLSMPLCARYLRNPEPTTPKEAP